jgi:hypothetical protein
MQGNGDMKENGAKRAAIEITGSVLVPAGGPHPGATEQVETPEQPIFGVIALIVGLIGVAIETIGSVISGRGTTEAPKNQERETSAVLPLLPYAGVALAADASRAIIALTRRAAEAGRPVASFAVNRTPLRGAAAAARRWLEDLSERGAAEQQERERAAGAFVNKLIPEITAALIERIDLNAVVDRIDVGRIAERLDLDAIIARLDLDTIVARLDLDAIAARLDVNAIVARVDMQAVVDSLDLAGITREVMDEVDVGEVIRESTGSIATETVDAVRYQGMNADRFLARLVDRILMRQNGRDISLPVTRRDSEDRQDDRGDDASGDHREDDASVVEPA